MKLTDYSLESSHFRRCIVRRLIADTYLALISKDVFFCFWNFIYLHSANLRVPPFSFPLLFSPLRHVWVVPVRFDINCTVLSEWIVVDYMLVSVEPLALLWPVEHMMSDRAMSIKNIEKRVIKENWLKIGELRGFYVSEGPFHVRGLRINNIT